MIYASLLFWQTFQQENYPPPRQHVATLIVFSFFQKLNASLCFLSPKKHSLFGVPIMAFGPPPYFAKGETGMIGFAYLFLSYYCNAVSQFCVLHFALCTLHLYFRRLKSFFYFGILNINTLFTTCSTLFVGYVV